MDDNKPPSKKLSLKDRVFSVKVKHVDGQEITYDASSGVFSQAVSGNITLQGSDGSQLEIVWEHPKSDNTTPRKTSKPFAERNARNDIREIDPYLVRKAFKKHENSLAKRNDKGCLEPTDIQKDAGGYHRVMLGYTWFRFTHVVAQFFKIGNTYDYAKEHDVAPNNVDCSHLCGNEWCANHQHLRFEPHNVNMERNQCHRVNKCSGHGFYGGCIIDN